MIFPRLKKFLTPLLLVGLLLVTACAPDEPSRWDAAQQESTQNQAPAGQPVSGGTFNQFFPAGGQGYNRVYTQEKQGFAQAKLTRNGQDVALLSISDTVTNPSAVQKFQQANHNIGGYPAVNEGANGTAVLVANRFQVKVQSRDPAFTQSDREAWLQQFNLNGLANVQ